MHLKTIATEAFNAASPSFGSLFEAKAMVHTAADQTVMWPPHVTPEGGVIGPFDWNRIVSGAKGNRRVAVLALYGTGVHASTLHGAVHVKLAGSVLQLRHVESSKANFAGKGLVLPYTLTSLSIVRETWQEMNEETAMMVEVRDIVPGMHGRYMQTLALLGITTGSLSACGRHIRY